MKTVAAENMGEFLRKKIERLGIKKLAAATQIGVSDATLRSWFRRYAPSMRPENRFNAAKLLGVSLDEFEAKLEAAARAEREQVVFEKGMRTSLKIQKEGKEELDRSVEPYSETKSHDIPLFELSVAAGTWTDVSDVEEVRLPGQIDHGFFRVRIAGESMQPDFMNGDVVEFHCLRVDREGPVEGREYYVQKSDGTATFKQLRSMDEDELVFVALNKKKFPKPMNVLRCDVVRMAEAIATVKLRR